MAQPEHPKYLEGVISRVGLLEETIKANRKEVLTRVGEVLAMMQTDTRLRNELGQEVKDNHKVAGDYIGEIVKAMARQRADIDALLKAATMDAKREKEMEQHMLDLLYAENKNLKAQLAAKTASPK